MNDTGARFGLIGALLGFCICTYYALDSVLDRCGILGDLRHGKAEVIELRHVTRLLAGDARLDPCEAETWSCDVTHASVQRTSAFLHRVGRTSLAGFAEG